MPIELHCKCGRHFSVPDDAVGTLAECPDCQGRIFVPSTSTGDRAADVTAPDRDLGADVEALTSDEMLALREDQGPAGQARDSGAPAGETQVVGSDVPGDAEGAGTPRHPVSVQETEVSPPTDQVVSGPEDSAVDVEAQPGPSAAAGAGGFTVRCDDVVQSRRRTYERCPQCDAELEADVRICTNCGYNLMTGERVRRVTVEAPDQAASERAAEVSVGVLSFLADWVVKLRYAILALSLLTALGITLGHVVSRTKEKNARRLKVTGGGLIGRLMKEAQDAVEKEAYDLSMQKRAQLELAYVKLNNEPRAEEGVFSPESKAAAHKAFIGAREARVMDGDPARAERILVAMDVLYAPMASPYEERTWGDLVRDELARVRHSKSSSRPASQPAHAPGPAAESRPAGVAPG